MNEAHVALSLDVQDVSEALVSVVCVFAFVGFDLVGVLVLDVFKANELGFTRAHSGFADLAGEDFVGCVAGGFTDEVIDDFAGFEGVPGAVIFD